MKSLIDTLKTIVSPSGQLTPKRRSRPQNQLSFQALQPRQLLATVAVSDGAWSDPATWNNGVPDLTQRAVVSQGITVELDGTNNEAQELVIHGDLVVSEEAGVDKSLTTRWVHVNSGGEFTVGSQANRYDEAEFTLNLTGTDVYADHTIPMASGMTMDIMNNDGFLMTAGGGRIQFFGEDKLSFTKLSATAEANATEIIVNNFIERNFNTGASNGDEFTTSAADDGAVNWKINDQIVIASSSYDYTEEEVRIITNIVDNGNDTRTITLNEALDFRHYGQTETYGDAANAEPGTTAAGHTYSIDLRAEVALLSRNIKIKGDPEQDTDNTFGDRWHIVTEEHVNGDVDHISGQTFTAAEITVEDRVRASGLSDAEANEAPDKQVTLGVGGHLMFMHDSGQITVDGVQLEGLGQTSQKGRYPIHWHLNGSKTGDVLRNTSITNSNNRGVTIHGTSDLTIEGVVLHDIHGHGFFFEDAAETGNTLVGNIALGIHTVGGNNDSFANPGGKDPFIVDTHDSVLETGSRFSSSAAFWITNPSNRFVGNIAAGADDARIAKYAETPGPAGTGFWYAIPRTVLGASADLNPNIVPIFSEFGQFDYNTSHSTAVGLNFDRGSDLKNANFNGQLRTNHPANEYSPRAGGVESGDKQSYFLNGFTNYKASDAAVYHRGDAESIKFNGLRIADSFNGPWAVSENIYNDSLFVGHSQGNADLNEIVGGPRLYDGSGLYTDTHFAGFAGQNAYTFQVEGSSFGPTMYHAFQSTSFEADGTYGNISHIVSDFNQEIGDGHDLGQPSKWIKGVLDLDGTFTSKAGGGIGFSIVPNVDFLVDSNDAQPNGWDALLTDGIYARIRVQNNDDGVPLFPSEVTGEPLISFTAADDDRVDVMAGQDINGDFYWTQIAAKTDGAGPVDDTLTIEFGRNGLPEGGFVLNFNNQDGGRPALVQAIEDKVNAARIVVKIVGAANYTPQGVTEVGSEAELRSARTGVVYFHDNEGNLFLNSGITDGQPDIQLTAGAPLQTPFVGHTIEYGSVIEAEDFDNGIQGIAYHDNDNTNTLGTYRGTGVDVTSTKVGNIADGEWLEYTTNITATAFNIGVNVSSTQSGGQIKVRVANSNSAGFLREVGVINVENTGGDFMTLWTEENADLTPFAGTESVIRLEFVGGGFEVDSIEFAEADQTPYVERMIAADFATTRIELEEFDNGGQGAAYFDDSSGNDSSDSFRTDEDVDTLPNQLHGRVFEGEWLEYTVDIEAGEYDITLRKDWGGDDSGVKLLIANENSALQFHELGQFDFSQGEFITLQNIDMTQWAGENRVIRIEIVGNWMGLDYLEFASKSQTAPTADIVDVTPDPRNTDPGVVTINFDEDVTGVDIGDLTLTRDGSMVDLSGLGVTENSPSQYTVDLSSVASDHGDYELRLNSAGSGIQDIAGNALATDAIDEFMIEQAAMPFSLGDVNQDGAIDFSDIPSFISILQSGTFLDEADINGDGVVDFSDISFFIDLLIAQ